MGRTFLRTAAVITLTALFTGTAATAGYAAVPGEEVKPPTPVDSPNGQYIVVLDEDPVASYAGGESGLVATKPVKGDKLDANSAAAQKYTSFLKERQADVAADAGVTPAATYQVTLNGFSAKLTAQQAAKLQGMKGVQGVFPDEIRHPDAAQTGTQFLGLEGAGGVWDSIGGIGNAGKGVVVGVVDTGIAPENPSFAGSPLSTTVSSTEPYLDAAANQVVFQKADGNTFRSTRVAGDQWNNDDYSTKLIGGQFFSAGAKASGFDFQYDILSPRDGAEHGSHTASTAAGNNGVEATVVAGDTSVDFSKISGVAPAAKIAAYKACYDGPDPAVTTDDICALSDLLSAINQSVKDGVDVINYSIGGGAATTVLGPEDISFFNAAAAGVFVSVSAGNSGPDASTADHASPWYTTVAASTIPTYEGTLQFPGFSHAGASVSIPAGQTITGPSVFAGDAGVVGAVSPNLCLPNTIDSAKVTGKIVVCERGSNARVDKSANVKAAGGIGMVLVNVTPNTVDNDFHTVPTIHMQSIYHDAILAYVRSGADMPLTLVGDNVSTDVTPVPQVAGFSSRGPDLADGADVLKPDIAAPGVAILAATNNTEGSAPTWNFLSGTSMAAPHIAGLAALYLSVHPTATPAEIKSTMMTTAYNTVNEDGSTNVDPFTQGAGQVDARKYFSPGLVYLNGVSDWFAYLAGVGLDQGVGVAAIDPSDLNLASIGIGSLSKKQTVTRTVTATQAGTYTASVSGMTGVDVTVSPSTFTVAAGATQTFTVTIENKTAPVEQWTSGFLTWTSGSTAVRSPIAVQPVTADAPAEVAGKAIAGSTDVTITPGLNGQLPLKLSGLGAYTLLSDPANPVPGHSGNENSGDADGNVTWFVDVPAGTTLSRFSLDSSDDTGSDLDLYVYRVVSKTDTRYYEKWQSATGSADEQVTVDNPTAGVYMVQTNVYLTSGPTTFDTTYANVVPGGAGSFTATPNPLPVTQGTPATYTLGWSGLTANTKYLGVVGYGDSSVRTVLTVDAGATPPAATVAPVISGEPKVGKTLKATAGTWDPAAVTLAYQWLRDGQPIHGATGTSYKVVTADVGTTLTVRVTATADGNVNPGSAVSNGLFVKFGSHTSVSMNRYIGTSS
ncbi:MAG: S8 family serine peptidase, partial [Actinobacteria bacterium]|nr:S8 family serine peptidase [Actinomycetota bacterium]